MGNAFMFYNRHGVKAYIKKLKGILMWNFWMLEHVGIISSKEEGQVHTQKKSQWYVLRREVSIFIQQESYKMTKRACSWILSPR